MPELREGLVNLQPRVTSGLKNNREECSLCGAMILTKIKCENRPVQFRISHLQYVVALAAAFVWTVPVHLPLRSICLYCLSSLVVAAQVCVARWCRPEFGEDPMRVAAFDLTHAVGNYTVIAWVFVAVCFGLMRD